MEQKEKLTKKTDRIDFMPLIKANHLGKQYYQFCFSYKREHPRCKSIRRLQYLFIKKAKLDFKAFIQEYLQDIENIRIVQTSWLED